jgi:hypothetical protein
LMDDDAWGSFRTRAKNHPRRRVLLVVPGPVLLPHPLHDLFSWVADKIENDPTLFERLETAVIGGAAGALGGAIVGGLGGFLVGGPAGAAAGAVGGAIVGGAVGATAGFFLEEIIEHVIVGPTIDLDIELWPAFPTSFDRMVTLLEELAEGSGTTRKGLVALIAGDVHFSYVMRGDLARTRNRSPVLHYTMSPFRQAMGAEDAAKAKRVMTGDYSDFPTALQLAVTTGVIYRPGFVDDQMRRLDWYPLELDGSRADPGRADDWSFFGNFVGHLELEGLHATSSYDRAVAGGPGGVHLEELGRLRSLAV